MMNDAAINSDLRPLELAVLQVVHALTITGRPKRCNWDWRKEYLDECKALGRVRADLTLADFGRPQVHVKYHVPNGYEDVPCVSVGQRRRFIVDKVPHALVQAELSFLPRIIHERMRIAFEDCVEDLVKSALKALVTDLLVERTGVCEVVWTSAYERPDGHLVYMDVDPPSWTVRLVEGPEDRIIRELDRGLRIPATAGDGFSMWMLDASALPGYVLTPRGRAELKGLPEILDPDAVWPTAGADAQVVADGTGGCSRNKKPGRRQVFDHDEDVEMVAEWEAAHKGDKRLTKAEYEKGKHLHAGTVDRAQARTRKRERQVRLQAARELELNTRTNPPSSENR